MLTLEALDERARYWSHALNLDHWNFDMELVEEIPDAPGALARIEPSAQADRAAIQIVEDVEERMDEEPGFATDFALVHEFLHAHMRDCDEAVMALFGDLGFLASSGHRHRWTHAEENFINRLAHAIVCLDRRKVVGSEADATTT